MILRKALIKNNYYYFISEVPICFKFLCILYNYCYRTFNKYPIVWQIVINL